MKGDGMVCPCSLVAALFHPMISGQIPRAGCRAHLRAACYRAASSAAPEYE